MPRVVDPDHLNHAIELYLTGKTIHECSAETRVGEGTIARELRARGIEPRKGTRPRIVLPDKEIIDQYNTGASEYTLSIQYGVSRGTITRVLRDSGVERRGCSDAGLVRAAKMSPEERQAQTAAAHIAATGRTATWEERALRAATVEKKPPAMSRHEYQFADWLGERHATYTREKAVGIYNVDFAVGSVAVEILGGEWHAYKATRHASRTPYILDQGWTMVFLWSTANCPMTPAVADYVVAVVDEVRRNPALIGEYRVVRGDGYLIASGRANDDEFAGIPSARQSYDAAS